MVLRFHRNLKCALSLLYIFLIIYYSKVFMVMGTDSGEADQIIYFVFDIIGSMIISII